ncbi:MAG: hypothetical protein JWO02_373 [Solirubrobacterales bacterium]|nr:hypothetical protein [Solirubrobacterales bacterium]
MADTGDTRVTVVMVVDDGSEVIVGHLDARRLDLALVDALARLQLVASRHGWLMDVRDPPEELCGLLEFLGLAEVLALEARREAERGEQLGVDEVVQPRDPPA